MKFQCSPSKNQDIWALASTCSFCFGLALSSVSALAAAGGSDRGGGDPCEDRIKIVRDDLRSWIEKDGPSGLSLPAGISVPEYSERMLTSIESAKIRCVGSHDSGFPVMINDSPKVCRFDRSDVKSQITCDVTKFASLSESDQYVLVHHEFAGLAGIERPNDDDSDYRVSNQISAHLADQMVKKLVVGEPSKPVPCASLDLRNVPVGTRCTTSKSAIYERVSRENFGEAWKGPDRLIWSDRIGTTISDQFEAVKTCKNLGGTLPERVDFERGKASGFLEVLPNLQDQKSWSSSLISNFLGLAPDLAYVFNGACFDGDCGFFNPKDRDYAHYTFRCVGR